MANEYKKDFNARLNDSKDMPKIINLDEDGAIKWNGKSMVVAPPIDYDVIMKKVPKGKLITINEIRKNIANKYNTEITCPLTAGIFINLVAWASSQRSENITPYWRTLKSNGELNPKYPGGIELQKKNLEAEGHKIITKGKTNVKYYVEDFKQSVIELY